MSKLDKYLSVYDTDVVLPGSNKKITIKPLTTNQLKKLLMYENEKNPIVIEEVVDKIIESTVQTENFNIDDLYLQDKYFLFVQIRRITKGDMYTFFFTCPECNQKSIQNINLDDLIIEKKKKNTDDKIKILNDKLTLKMGYIKRGEQKEAYNNITKNKNTSDTEYQLSMAIATLAAAIKEIHSDDGVEELNIKEKMNFIEKLPEPEYKKINQWFEKYDFGVKLNFELQCRHCNFKSYDSLPVDNFFG